MSEIRQLLASAQQAEIQGDLAEAVRWLRQAEAWYHQRQLLPRAEQMRRNIDRLGARFAPAEEEDPFGFGEGLGPGADPPAPPPAPAARPPPLRPLLPDQQRAREALTRRAVRLALLLGPEGSGKSTVLAHLGAPLSRLPPASPSGPVLLEPAGPLEEVEVDRLLGWLDAGTSAVLALRGAAPAPALLLASPEGPVPLHDTAALHAALPEVPLRLLGRVELVVELPSPGPQALLALARARLAAAEVALPEEAIGRLVELALASPRGAHELVVLVARIPPGRYGGP